MNILTLLKLLIITIYMKIFFIFLFIVSLSTEGNSFENPKNKIEKFFYE